MKKPHPIRAFLSALCFLAAGTALPAQSPAGAGDLYREIARQDSLLFAAFNAGDVEPVRDLFSKDCEFYHDISGLAGYEQTIASLADLFARGTGIRRELVSGSLEVYPIPGFGAAQIGEHTFCHPENGRMDCGTFKFIHVWRKEADGRWRIARAVSVGH